MSEKPSTNKKDDSLDLASDEADPLKCLYSRNVQVPDKRAPLYDNLSRFSVGDNNEVTVKTITVKPKALETTEYDRPEIRATLVQKKVKEKKNILTKIDKINKGPLLALKNCMIQKIPVKVFTRNHSSIRGYCTGIVVLFDKHWNLALQDVHEVWTRPKKKLKSIYYLENQSNYQYQVKHRCTIPPIKILESSKKSELCERHLDQIMIRGEHVVSVCALNYVEL
uniref:U7 snRNA-associated Sm-like protein LSm11 n=1 Tax=Cacopsylla melanoneura TaxID=428564 RepID=A0A8D9AXB8_9HEMI